MRFAVTLAAEHAFRHRADAVFARTDGDFVRPVPSLGRVFVAHPRKHGVRLVSERASVLHVCRAGRNVVNDAPHGEKDGANRGDERERDDDRHAETPYGADETGKFFHLVLIVFVKQPFSLLLLFFRARTLILRSARGAGRNIHVRFSQALQRVTRSVPPTSLTE